MATGRIETYVHSDSTTENKGVAVVRVITDTDFGARTDEVKEFAKAAARYAYATLAHTRTFIASGSMWNYVIAQYPELEEQRKLVARDLKETIKITEIAILTL